MILLLEFILDIFFIIKKNEYKMNNRIIKNLDD